MFNWVVKVVPQPPDAPGTDESSPAEVVKSRQVSSPPLKSTEEASEDSQGQTGVLGWLSNGFVSALPQPSSSPGLSRANSDARLGEAGERSGVIGWVAQGLTKVLPQPDEKYKEEQKTDEDTEVYDIETLPDYDPYPHIPVVEMVSEEEVSEVEDTTPQFPPNVVNWIKQIIPQPVPPGAIPPEPKNKSSRPSLDKIFSPPPESLSGISLDTDSKASSVVGWFVSGLGLKMPQPALPPKEDTEDATEVLQKASDKLKPDMVLEDVESDNEGQPKREDSSKATVSSTSQIPAPAAAVVTAAAAEQQLTQSNDVRPESAEEPQQPENVTKMSQEDAETQTGRWTPFIESIKREAEGVALATMEERLLQERFEMARMAEEVARQTAETAIRQMTSEGHSIKLSLGSQELLEEPDQEKEESLLQEEQKVETVEPEPKEEEEPQRASPSPPPNPEPVKPSQPEPEHKPEPEAKPEPKAEPKPEPEAKPEPKPEPEAKPEPKPEPQPEPKTKTQEVGAVAEPVTKQPQKAEGGQVSKADKAAEKEEEEESLGEECGDSSSLSLRPAVNVEDVDSGHERKGERGRGGRGGGRGGTGVDQNNVNQILTPQDPKLTTLTVPVTPSGGRQSKGDKE